MSRPSDERLYGSGSRDTFGYTQCYASLGTPDGGDFTFAKCDDKGNFTLEQRSGWRLETHHLRSVERPDRRWHLHPGSRGQRRHQRKPIVMDRLPTARPAIWEKSPFTRGRTTFPLVRSSTPTATACRRTTSRGSRFVPTNIRYRDGSISNLNSTDLQGFAGFNEVFPIFNWYVMETDSNRYKNTGTHVINDAGGPADSTDPCGGGFRPCGTSDLMANLANTHEEFSIPTALRVPGAVYCDNADCNGFSIASRPASGGPGRFDRPNRSSLGYQLWLADLHGSEPVARIR